MGKLPICLTRVISLFSIALLSVPFTFAIEFGNGIGDALFMIAGPNGIAGWLSNDYIVFGVVVVVFFLILLNVFKTLLKRVKIFEGEGGEGISKSGNMVAVGFGLLGTIGIFYRVSPGDSSFIQMLTIFGSYSIILFMILTFWITFKAAKGD